MNEAHELGEWLPDPIPPENDPEWDRRVARILAAAEPALARMAGRSATATEAWLSEMGGWWRPVAALAAAAVAFLLLVTEAPGPGPNAPEPDAMTLTILASDGDPTAIWAAMGVPADPVLALLSLEDHSTFMAPPEGAPR
ncbi:MAG: hypothetical protein LC667_05370 [Thioalkalivibrio sp.]|nr:hypothetical protein [Thioalkalivibrio sp.]